MGVLNEKRCKTAQKCLNTYKKENNNKDYRYKKFYKCNRFASRPISFSYLLRTKHGICINESTEDYFLYNYVRHQNKNPYEFNFEEHSEEENKIIQQEAKDYFLTGKTSVWCSTDKTRSNHSKNVTKKRKNARQDKWEQCKNDFDCEEFISL